MKRLVLVCLIILFCVPVDAYASTAPYITLTEDNEGELITTLDGYIPSSVLDTFDGKRIKNAQDLFVDEHNLLYIADTGNKRVVCTTAEGDLVRVYGEKKLKKPTGVCVRLDKVYVADTSLKAIVVYDQHTGEELMRYEKPEEPLYGEELRFEPTKVQVSAAGVVYAICNGNGNGVAMLAADGTFLGYFAANSTTLGIGDILKRVFYSPELLASLRQNVPNTPANLTMDSLGLIYTATTGAGTQTVKRFNMAGENLLLEPLRLDDVIIDVAVGSQGTFYAANQNGYIYEYTEEGRLLFFFGGEDKTGSRDALFKKITAICVDAEGNLYVLDSSKNLVQSFTQTTYAQLLHQAVHLWQEGKYAESREPWEEVLSYNGLFDFAYVGLGKAYYKLEQYELARDYFRLGGEKDGYSDAWWETRAVMLQDGLVWLLAAYILWRLIRRIPKPTWLKRTVQRLRETGFVRALTLIRRTPLNPAAAFEAVKYHRAISAPMATVLYVLLLGVIVLGKYASAFLFKLTPDGEYAFLTDFALVFGLLALFLVSLNLVCSTRTSEARFRDMYCALPCALCPIYLIQPLLVAVGYLLTYNEQFIIWFSTFIMISGSVVLVVVMIRELQNYTYGETFRVVLLTLFVMVVIALSLVIAAILIAQLITFFVTIVQEVSYHVQ